ncbi:hypothetical protein [Paludibaculum fermentans]|uniref:Uncharacterized protein n=1 Tax=Paludibaculum fermentans TaxID=1473598 RepID=A0A7S7NXR7_PALFE|nr:hypothetical protein [Paludibaculum fermentans]QOY91730.1 hypothetical protein IRI77_17845 [Paludibaculum fermentans]
MFGTQPVTYYVGSVVHAIHGGLQQAALGNGVTESTVYNARLQPTPIQAGLGILLVTDYRSPLIPIDILG